MLRALLTVCLLLPVIAVANSIEEPAWELVDQIGPVELRRYEPSIEARTPLQSSRETTGGFGRLAGYIFGDNVGGEKIAMTAPVTETLVADGPVMSFTMPSAYDMAALPTPHDDSVTLHEVPGRTVAAVRFSGWATGGKVRRFTRELLTTLEQQGITVSGDPSLNQYNPPWTPPFMRRNEITVEVSLN